MTEDSGLRPNASTAGGGRTDLEWLLEELVASGGDAIEAIILYGSQLFRASPNRYSAWDFVVIVEDYDAFHRALVRAGHHIRSPRTLTRLARVLPPSITAFTPAEDGIPVAKCGIVDRRDFETALSPASKDHFLKGRLVQQVRVEWARGEEERSRTLETLADARARVLDWAGPWLTVPITPDSLPAEMLAVSYGGEVRPESTDRVLEVVEAQADWLRETYAGVLEREAESGRLTRVDGGYAFAEPPTESDRHRIARYFARSKRRATMRWAKHMLTFNDWLTYIQRKAERRTGLAIEITPAERRWPLLLLWPKVFRVLRARNAPLPDGPDDSPSAPPP